MAEHLSKERLKALKNEIVMAQAFNREELEPIMAESLERYCGLYVPDFGADWDIVLNEVYPIIQNSLPAIFFRNPRVFLKPRNKTFIVKRRNPVSGRMEEVQADSSKSALTQEHILNYLLQEIKYKRQVRKTLLDALLFPYGVLWHGYKGDFGMTEEKSIYIKDAQIFAQHILPSRFLKDPSVSISELDEAKWVGRIIDIPYRDFIEDDELGIDKNIKIKGFRGYGQKIGSKSIKDSKKVKGGADSLKIGRKPLLESATKEFQESDDANFVRVVEVYLRPTKKEKREGKKGWILLVTEEQDKPLRENPWEIKAEGWPAQILEFNEVPNGAFGLADVDTYKTIADHKNLIINQQIRNAQETGKTWVGLSVENANEEDIEAAAKGENSIIRYDGDNIKGRMFVASAAGQGSSELYLLDQRIQQNLEEKSGITDLKKGVLKSGEESATSVKIRTAGGGARPAYRQDIMADFLSDSVHYLNQLNKQFMTIKEAVRIIGSLDLQWSENPSKEEIQADVDVELDVISMLPESPEKEIQEYQIILKLIVEALTIPELRRKILEEKKTINISPVIEQLLMRLKIRDPEIFRTIRPEEAEGFASIQQLKQAQVNVQSVLKGEQLPFPPRQGDDHRVKLEVYSSVQQLLQQMGQVSELLNQLIELQSAILKEEMDKQAKVGQQLSKPSQPIKLF